MLCAHQHDGHMRYVSYGHKNTRAAELKAGIHSYLNRNISYSSTYFFFFVNWLMHIKYTHSKFFFVWKKNSVKFWELPICSLLIILNFKISFEWCERDFERKLKNKFDLQCILTNLTHTHTSFCCQLWIIFQIN